MMDSVITALSGTNMALAATLSVLAATLLCIVWSRRKNLVDAPSLLSVNRHVENSGERSKAYTDIHGTLGGGGGGSEAQRLDQCQDMVNQYYDMATDFYEFGWGESFHFAPRDIGETFEESLKRHEYYLASQLGIKEGMRVLDLGCGVGGPMRNIARFSGASVTGLNNNAYQVTRGNAKNKSLGLQDQCNLVKGDFMASPFKTAEFDRAYAIEATCHAPDRTACFAEVLRTLKPGGSFAVYEWVYTSKYDANNTEHAAIKTGIEIGNGLPTITDAQAVIDAMTAAGFEDVVCRDLAVPPSRPHHTWYAPLEGSWTLSGIKSTPIGIAATGVFVRIMEFLRLAPKGTAKMHQHLSTGADTLKRSGQLGIFTPMLFVQGRKPAAATTATAAAQ